MDIVGAIGAVTAAIGLARELNNVDVALDQAALKLKVAELTGALAEAKLGLIDVAEQLRDRDSEITRLKAFDQQALSAKVFFEGFHLDKSPDGRPSGDPYCPYCIDKKAGLFRLTILNKPGRPSGCPNCKNEFTRVPHFDYHQSGSA